MLTLSQLERSNLARRLNQLRDRCARAVTDELYAQSAACSAQFGDRGREHCLNDLGFHVQFLAASVEANSIGMFQDYLKWCDGVLASRGLECEPAARTAQRIARHLSELLAPQEWTPLQNFLSSEGAQEEGPSQPGDSAVPEPLRLAREAYIAALIAANRSAALTVAQQCIRDGFSLADIYVEVIAAALHRVGSLWEANRITVAQEHIATAITQIVIGALYSHKPRGGRVRGHALVTGVAGEAHQLGGNLLADALEAKGWDVTFLGSNVPTRAAIELIATVNPDVLCISTTLAVHLPAASELIQQVRQRFASQRPEILVGGAAFDRAPASYIYELGVRHEDLRGALRLLCPEELPGQSPVTV